MTRYIVLLRAINITGRSVKMDALRGHLTDMGLAGVATYIASGNVLFSAAEPSQALEARIEAHLARALGFEVTTFLRTAAEMTAVAKHQPFAAADIAAAFGLMVAFLKEPPDDDATAQLMTFRGDSDDFAVHGREVYWLRRTQQSSRDFSGARLERLLRMPATLRSITTVNKLATLSQQEHL